MIRSVETSKKKILIVSYTFYPDNNPRSLRWQSLGAQFIEQGYEVHVLTYQNSQKEGFKIFGQRNIVYQGTRSIEKSVKEVLNLKNSVQIFKKKIRKIFKYFIWPDFSAGWLPWAICKLSLICRQHTYERVISSSHPMSGHVPVLLLKKMGFLKSTQWIVDIGDPFGLIKFHNLNNQFLYQKLNYKFEEAVCKTANLICVTTKQTRDLYIDGYKLAKEKVVIAPPVLSFDLEVDRSSYNPYSTVINFIFAGTLYKEIRNPKIVLEFAEYLEFKYPARYNFHFFGVLGDCAEYFKSIGPNIHIYGLVDRLKLAPYFNHSNAIINIGNTSKYQLPSKIIEAIASKKFIFNFCFTADDTSADFLTDYPGHFNIYSANDFEEAINRFQKSLTEKEKIESAAEKIITNHSPRLISDLFLKK